jgi:hypothetical protein
VLADDHHPLDRLAPSEELRLSDDGRATTAGLPALPAPLALGLEPRRALDRPDVGDFRALLTRWPDVDDGVRRVIGTGRLNVDLGAGTRAATTPAALRRRSCLGGAVLALARLLDDLARFRLFGSSTGLGLGLSGSRTCALTTTAAATATATAGRRRALLAALAALNVFVDIAASSGWLLSLGPGRRRRSGSGDVRGLEDNQRWLEQRLRGRPGSITR